VGVHSDVIPLALSNNGRLLWRR